MNPRPGADEASSEQAAAAGAPRTPLASPGDPGWIARQVISQRRRRGMAQVDLAVAAEWSERSIQRLEKGQLQWVRGIEAGVPATRRQRAHLERLGEALAVQLVPVPEVVASRPAPPEPATVLAAAPAPVIEPTISRPTPPPSVRRPRWRPPLRLGVLAAATSALVTGAGLAYATGAVSVRLGSAPRPPVTAAVTATQPARGHRPRAAEPRPPAAAPAAPPASVALVPPGTPAPPIVAPAPPMPAPRPPVAQLAALDVVTSPAREPRPPGPQASLSTTLVDFGTVPAGSKVSRSVTLTNTGTAPLHLGLPVVLTANDLDVATDCTNRTLVPGQHCTFTLSFSPGSGTRLNASVSINDDTPRAREEFEVRGSSP